jgi:multiple sugar transport system permease protein
MLNGEALSSSARRRQGRKGISGAWPFIIPSLIFMAVLFVYPMVQVIYLSFQDSHGMWNGLGLYAEMLTDNLFWLSLKNSFVFTFGSVVLHFIVGLSLALLLSRKLNNQVLGIFRGILIVPFLMPAVVVATNWKLIFYPLGVLSSTLFSMHLIPQPLDWIGDPRLAMGSILLVNLWRAYPFYMILLLAGLQAIPTEMYEAATIDGADGWKSLMYITIPQLRGVIILSTLLDTIYTFRTWDLTFLLTHGGPMNRTELIANYVYDMAMRFGRPNYASAMGFAMLFLSLVFTVFYLRFYGEEEEAK